MKKYCLCAQLLSHVRLFVGPWTVDHQRTLSMEFSRQENWSGLPFPIPGHLPDPGIELTSLASPTLAGRFFFFNYCTAWEPKLSYLLTGYVTTKSLTYHPS